MEATKKQTWRIFCLTGYDVRECNLDIDQASNIISRLTKGESFDCSTLPNARLVKAVGPKQDWAALYESAVKAGEKAMAECTPRPMVVQQHKNMADDNSPVKKEWFVEGGVCGFAWVRIRPGNCSFVLWFKKTFPRTDTSSIHADNKNHIYGDKSYYGGFELSVMSGGQSYERKLAYARAMAEVLRTAGLKAHANGRLD